MADTKLTGLSETSVPATGDVLYTVDVSDTTDDAAGSSRSLTFSRLGGFLQPGLAQGRLTLATGTPVTTADQTGKTTIYFTPYNGNRVSVYDGTRWRLYTFSEVSLALGTLTSGKNYDVFLYDNSGTLTLELSSAWTNDTTRADALTTQDGVQVKSGATTRLYLGTFRTVSTTQTEDSAKKRFVWNLYNRVRRYMQNPTETANFWSYSSTWRQANANASNQVEYVVGLSLDSIRAQVTGLIYANSGVGEVAVGVDSTSTPSGYWQQTVGGAVEHGCMNSEYCGFPGLGYHYLAWLENRDSGSPSFYGDASSTVQCGIYAEVWG